MYRNPLLFLSLLAGISGLASAQPNHSTPMHFRRAFNTCTAVENPVSFYGSATNAIPTLPVVLGALHYKWDGQNYQPPKGKQVLISSGIVSAPKHGTLKLFDAVNHLYWYEGTSGYRGRDHAILWILVGQNTYKLNLRVDVVGNIDLDKSCGQTPTHED